MSGYTAGHGLDATVYCTLFCVGKKNSPFCFSWQTVERIVTTKKEAFWQLWNRDSPEYGSDPLSQELVLIKKKLADEKLCLCELRLEKKNMQNTSNKHLIFNQFGQTQLLSSQLIYLERARRMAVLNKVKLW